MTDLTGAELDLATARAINLPVELRAAFRPSLGGAAAWEVLEWVLRRGLHVEMWRDRLDGCTVCWILDRLGNGRLVADGIGPADGPTDAIAICRAVVALGEAG